MKIISLLILLLLNICSQSGNDQPDRFSWVYQSPAYNKLVEVNGKSRWLEPYARASKVLTGGYSYIRSEDPKDGSIRHQSHAGTSDVHGNRINHKPTYHRTGYLYYGNYFGERNKYAENLQIRYALVDISKDLAKICYRCKAPLVKCVCKKDDDYYAKAAESENQAFREYEDIHEKHEEKALDELANYTEEKRKKAVNALINEGQGELDALNDVSVLKTLQNNPGILSSPVELEKYLLKFSESLQNKIRLYLKDPSLKNEIQMRLKDYQASVPGRSKQLSGISLETVSQSLSTVERIRRKANYISILKNMRNELENDNVRLPRLSNYPNPFNPKTSINYYLPNDMNIELTIYNSLGQKIKNLVNSYQKAGEYSIDWDAKNDSGLKASSGIYYYRLRTDKTVITKQMVLMK